RAAGWLAVFSLPRVLRWLARFPDPARLSRFPDSGLPLGLLFRSHDRHGGILVSGSDLVSVRHQHAQLFRLGAHVSPGSLAFGLGRRPEGAAVSIPGLLSGHGFSGQSGRAGSCVRAALRASLGVDILAFGPLAVWPRLTALQRLWRIKDFPLRLIVRKCRDATRGNRSTMKTAARYFRLWLGFARFGLVRELSFRSNFLVKISVEILWLAILLVFYRTVFAQTNLVAGWNEFQFLFFVGCYFALGGLVETLFLENCNEF